MQSFSTRLIKVGNSKGVILPKKALEQLGIDDNGIQVKVSDEAIVLTPVRKHVRKGWSKAFKKMHKDGDDKSPIPDLFDNEPMKDWKW